MSRARVNHVAASPHLRRKLAMHEKSRPGVQRRVPLLPAGQGPIAPVRALLTLVQGLACGATKRAAKRIARKLLRMRFRLRRCMWLWVHEEQGARQDVHAKATTKMQRVDVHVYDLYIHV